MRILGAALGSEYRVGRTYHSRTDRAGITSGRATSITGRDSIVDSSCVIGDTITLGAKVFDVTKDLICSLIWIEGRNSLVRDVLKPVVTGRSWRRGSSGSGGVCGGCCRLSRRTRLG